LKDIWTGDYWPGNRPSYNYRPLTTTSFAVAARLSENNVALQRWINIILHAMCSLLIFSISLKLNMRLKAALLTGLLFAIHPIHSESLFMVVGRSEMLVALFCFVF
jgi:dolichyl-phosphate-mannose--protein O-mannosyl transferase